ncbi:hypothetical protein LUU34_00649200 [Aix galericulata]|nr:hypothetical protein LUU34_00649200 [Aix galericulata]
MRSLLLHGDLSGAQTWCGATGRICLQSPELCRVQMVLVEIAPCHLWGCAQDQAAGEEFPHLVGAGFRRKESPASSSSFSLPFLCIPKKLNCDVAKVLLLQEQPSLAFQIKNGQLPTYGDEP